MRHTIIRYQCIHNRFLLTHLMRGATRQRYLQHICRAISTHAPHARCDPPPLTIYNFTNISTHAPHARCDLLKIQIRNEPNISTHAPHARCDPPNKHPPSEFKNFYSRTSCEVRLTAMDFAPARRNFYSRTSCEVRPINVPLGELSGNFYSRTSCEVRLTAQMRPYWS